LTPPAVKVCAQERGIPVLQPLHFREQADRDALAAFCPDVLVVAAYGLILPQAVLDMPRIGPFNVHGSLLPRYRGAAPIQRAIMDGNALTGVTIMRMERGLDTGPMLAQRAIGIDLADTAATLYAELAELGGTLMVETLERLTAGKKTSAPPLLQEHAVSDPTSLVPPTPIAQDETCATYAAKLVKADGFIDWDRPVREIHARIRGVTPWPGAQTVFLLPDREPLMTQLQPGTLGSVFAPDAPHPAPGTLQGLRNGQLAIACTDALYLLSTLKPAAGKPMSGEAFWNGYCRAGHATTPCRAISPAVSHATPRTPSQPCGDIHAPEDRV
ncbi:MAG: methionyl-tRNA formyltransferase, partial [Bilophila sp.]